MTLPNISCLKTDETFKNKQTLAHTKRVLKRSRNTLLHDHINQSVPRLSYVSPPHKKMTSDNLRKSCGKVFVNLCVIGTLIALITPQSGAVEIDESPVSINKPIMKDVPDLPGWVRFSTEYVRCFCNLPVCVSTGYMCKSSGGGCFSNLLDQANQAVPSNVYRGIHGCLELLSDRDQRNWCQNNPSSTARSTYRKKNHPKSLLLCCYRDMCNHADNPETRILLNDTAMGDTAADNDNKLPDSIGTKQDPALYTDSEVWFRAATIAVPICGAVILVALIGLAIRLLRTESSGNSTHKLGMPPSYMLPSDSKSTCHKIHHQQQSYHNIITRKESLLKDSHHHNPIYSNDIEDVRGQTYVPLLIQGDSRNLDRDCDSKNETNAKLNFMQDLGHCTTTLNACDDVNIVSPNLFHKNADLHIGRNIILSGNFLEHQDTNFDKIYNKESIS